MDLVKKYNGRCPDARINGMLDLFAIDWAKTNEDALPDYVLDNLRVTLTEQQDLFLKHSQFIIKES